MENVIEGEIGPGLKLEEREVEGGIYGVKMFGYQIWKSEDADERPFDMGAVREGLMVRFVEVCYNTFDFIDMVAGKISQINSMMDRERVTVNSNNLRSAIKPDTIFKFEVKYKEKKWTLYKGYSQFEVLQKEVEEGLLVV